MDTTQYYRYYHNADIRAVWSDALTLYKSFDRCQPLREAAFPETVSVSGRGEIDGHFCPITPPSERQHDKKKTEVYVIFEVHFLFTKPWHWWVMLFDDKNEEQKRTIIIGPLLIAIVPLKKKKQGSSFFAVTYRSTSIRTHQDSYFAVTTPLLNTKYLVLS